MMKMLKRIPALALFPQPLYSNSKGWHFGQSILFPFSKIKKAKPELQVPTIHIKQFSEEHDGFLLYKNQEGIRIKAITIAFIVCFLSGFWTYTHLDDD